jgi:hypothetical protein
MARPEPNEGVSRFVITSEDMMEFKTIKLFLQPPNLQSICLYAGVAVVWLSIDLVDDDLRVAMYVKSLDAELGGDAQVLDECLIFHHIVGHVDVQSNYIEELISLMGDQYDTSPSTVEGERAIKIHALVLVGHRGWRLLSLCPLGHKIC